MIMKFFNLITIVILSLITMQGYSQEKSANEMPGDSKNESLIGKIKIFLDCDDCNASFFRRNLTCFDFARDAKLADIHVFVTKQKTGSNATEYGMNFIGMNNYTDLRYKLKTISPQDETDILKWERLLKIIDVGLLPYLSRTPEITAVNIKHNTYSAPKVVNIDPWNFWIFRLDAGSEFKGEKSKNKFALSSSVKADRITETFKFKSEVSYNLNKEIYNNSGEKIISTKKEAEINSRLIYSISSRWSVGVFGKISTSTYLNLHSAINVGPAIEYNIFPWDKSDNKVFTIGYNVKANSFSYNKLTIFNEMREMRMSESLKLSLLLRQPWGVVENTLEGSHFLHDLSKNRLSLKSDIAVRVARGLSFFIKLETDLIHDQLYLPAGGITREEVLLQQSKLATNFELSTKLGIRYTFGSNFNNIINQRL